MGTIEIMNIKTVLWACSLCVMSLAHAKEVHLADSSASANVEAVASPKSFEISVVFNPITTLDKVSNAEMTEVIAQFYADEALSSFLGKDKAIIYRRTKFSHDNADEGKVKWKFVVPDDAVIDASVKCVEVRESMIGKKSRKRVDVKTRIQDFRSTCFRDLRIAEGLFAEEVSSTRDSNAKEKLRRRIGNAFRALRRKISADDDLFRAEKEELIKKANKVEEYLKNKLKGNGAESDDDDARDTEVPVVDAVFKHPFGELLKADAILLTHGGARFVELDGDTIAILSVGFAPANHDDREDIAELKASAELGKLQAGEESVVMQKLDRQYNRSTKNGEVSEHLDVKRTTVTTVASIDFHKSGETVGTWLSKDRKRFFLAKGRIVKRNEKEINVR